MTKSILGTVPDGQPSGRHAEKVLAGELLSAFRHFATTQTEFMERLAGEVINNVLDVATVTIPTTGYIQRDYHVAAGSVAINNLSGANTLTVHTGGPGSGAPTGGTGVYKIGPNTHRTVALGAREFTIWGTAADTFCFQVFTKAIEPAS